jgi:molecular chaperone GrpE
LSDEERRIEIEGEDEEDALEETTEDALEETPEEPEKEEPEEEEEPEEDEDSPEAVADALAKADEEAAQGAPEWEIPEEDLGDLDLSEFKEKEKAGTEAATAEQLKELNDKYVRLYAQFENYKKKAAKDKEELTSYVKEEVIYELLPSLDHLDIALKHANEDESSGGLRQGVEMTLRELYRTLEKFGLKVIEAQGKPFDPEYHHAMSQVETDEVEEKTVMEEFRKGYMFGDKVLRAAMVSVSRKPGEQSEQEEDTGEEAEEESENNTNDTKEED